MVKNKDGENQTTSDMNPKDGNSIKIVKTGNTISVYVKKATGEYEQKIAPQTMAIAQTKGAITYIAQGTTYYSLDDIEISAFKLYDETGITVATATSIAPTATEATGEITLANYTNTDMEMAVVTVAYGANGKMLGAYYNGEDNLAAGGRQTVSFTLNNLYGEAVSVKAFVWDNATNKSPMTVHELIATE